MNDSTPEPSGYANEKNGTEMRLSATIGGQWIKQVAVGYGAGCIAAVSSPKMVCAT